jgi:hypothetical protein
MVFRDQCEMRLTRPGHKIAYCDPADGLAQLDAADTDRCSIYVVFVD